MSLRHLLALAILTSACGGQITDDRGDGNGALHGAGGSASADPACTVGQVPKFPPRAPSSSPSAACATTATAVDPAVGDVTGRWQTCTTDLDGHAGLEIGAYGQWRYLDTTAGELAPGPFQGWLEAFNGLSLVHAVAQGGHPGPLLTIAGDRLDVTSGGVVTSLARIAPSADGGTAMTPPTSGANCTLVGHWGDATDVMTSPPIMQDGGTTYMTRFFSFDFADDGTFVATDPADPSCGGQVTGLYAVDVTDYQGTLSYPGPYLVFGGLRGAVPACTAYVAYSLSMQSADDCSLVSPAVVTDSCTGTGVFGESGDMKRQ